MHRPDLQGIGLQFLRFSSVGAVGLVVDLAMTLLLAPSLGADYGRIAAILIAVAVTFVLNRQHTFRTDHSPVVVQAWRYFLVSAAGAGVNLAVYHACLLAIAAVQHGPASSSWLCGAVAIGSLVAMAVNFCGSRLFAFAK